MNPDKSRRGIFHLGKEIIESGEIPGVIALMSFVPTRVEYQYGIDQFEYMGFSPLFDSIEEGENPPTYIVEMTMSDGILADVKVYRRD